MRPAQQPRPKPKIPLPLPLLNGPLRCVECGDLMPVDEKGRAIIKGLCLTCLTGRAYD